MSTQRVVLLFVVIFFLTMAGVITTVMMNSSSEPTIKKGQVFEDEDEGQKKKSEEPAGEDEANGKKVTQREKDLQLFLKEPFFRLPTIVIPILRDENILGLLHLRIVMESTNHEAFERAKILMPRLVDAIYCDLFGALGTLWLAQYDPSPIAIQGRIKKLAEDIYGPDIILQVSLKDFLFSRT